MCRTMDLEKIIEETRQQEFGSKCLIVSMNPFGGMIA